MASRSFVQLETAIGGLSLLIRPIQIKRELGLSPMFTTSKTFLTRGRRLWWVFVLMLHTHSSKNKTIGTIAHLSDKQAIGKHLEKSLQR